MVADLGATQEMGRGTLPISWVAVDAGVPPGREEETMAALGAIQEMDRTPPTAVDAAVPPGQDKEMMAALGPPRRQVGRPNDSEC